LKAPIPTYRSFDGESTAHAFSPHKKTIAKKIFNASSKRADSPEGSDKPPECEENPPDHKERLAENRFQDA
jgi:hypothetical protein